MTADILRTNAAWAAVYLTFTVLVVHSFYGNYLIIKIQRSLRHGASPLDPDSWTPEHLKPGKELFLIRFQRWRRSRRWVWIGCIVLGNALYFVLKP